MSKPEKKMRREEVYEMIKVALNEDEVDIDASTEFSSLAGWDSMGVLLLMAELDEKLGMVLEEKQLVALKTVNNLLDIIIDNEKLLD